MGLSIDSSIGVRQALVTNISQIRNPYGFPCIPHSPELMPYYRRNMRLAIVSSRNPDACEAQALAADIQEEIRFLKYRLEVLEGRPSSPARDSHIKATIARLN